MREGGRRGERHNTPGVASSRSGIALGPSIPPSPLAEVPDPLRWEDLSSEAQEHARLALVLLLAWSGLVEDDVFRRGRGRRERNKARRRIRQMWKDFPFAELWRRLEPSSRVALVREGAHDLEQFSRLSGLDAYGLKDWIGAPCAWAKATPAPDLEDAARAIFRRAVRKELRKALALNSTLRTEDLRTDFWAKLAGQADDPSLIRYLTQPYVQACARNFLRDEVRAALRDAANRPVRTSECQLEPGGVCGNLRADLGMLLSPRELQILELRVDGASDLEIARQLSLPIAEVRRTHEEIQDRLRPNSSAGP